MNGASIEVDLGAVIDRLLTVDVYKRGIITALYDAAHDLHGGSPTMAAAERLHEVLSPGDEVLICTGFRIAPTYVAETDGPIGAASLARALKEGLGVHPTILAEAEAVGPITAAARTYGLNVADWEAARETHSSCTVESFPTNQQEAEAEADRLFDERDPAAVFALECVAANHHGEYHMSHGWNITDYSAKMEPLFERDALTVGIGDGGNELGMGTIEEQVRESVPYGDECGCGCGGGIAAHVPADILVPVTVSNWGGHGIVAALSTMDDNVTLHPPEHEKRALIACGRAGAIDGLSGRTDGTCDAMSPDTHASVVTMLHEIVGEPPGRFVEG